MKGAKLTKLVLLIVVSTVLTSTMFPASASPVVTTLIDDGFEGTPWNDNWDQTGSLWYRESFSSRVRSGSYSATSSFGFSGSFTSDSVDASDAASLHIEFWCRTYGMDDPSDEIWIEYWDGAQWDYIMLLDRGTADQGLWWQYSDDVSDSAYFVDDFQIRITSVCGSGEYASIDDVLITKTVNYYNLYTYVEGYGSVQVGASGPHLEGTSVSIQAIEIDANWEFTSWEDDLSGNTNPTSIVMDGDKVVTAVFTPIEGITVQLSASAYNYDETMVVQIRKGAPNGDVMIQINLGSSVKWADQRTLGPTGNLDYTLKIPSSWGQGTFTIRVKDVVGETTAESSYTVPKPAPPSGGGGGVGGGGLILPTPLQVSRWSPIEAANELKNFRAASVARVLAQVEDSEHVAKIIELFDTEYALNVLEELGTAKSVTLMKLMDDESVVRLMLEFSEANKEMLEGLLDDDFNRTAGLVETAIKEKAAGLSDEERKQALEKLAGAVSSLDKESIIELLIYMAKLPETPTTVAYLLESMPLSTVIDVVEAWVTDTRYTEAIPDLVNVLGEVPTQLLGDVYVGIGNVERETLYPYLTAEMVAGLPEIGEFQITNLVASPSTVRPSEEVTVSYKLSNVGNQTDRYVIPLKVNGVTVATDTGLLGNGTSMELSHRVTYAQTGTYSVIVEEASTSFTVEQPPTPLKPADLQVTNIELVPASVTRGEDVSVFVTVTNLGELSGTASFAMKLDAEDISSKEATLGGGDAMNIVFTIVADYAPGIHEVRVGSLSVNLTVQEAPRQTPWFTIITGAIIIVAGLGLYFYNKRTQAFERPINHSNDVPDIDG